MLFASLRIVFFILTLVLGCDGYKKNKLLKSPNSRQIRYHFHCLILPPPCFNLEKTFVRKGWEGSSTKGAQLTIKAKGESLSEISAFHDLGHLGRLFPTGLVRFCMPCKGGTNCPFPGHCFEGCSYNSLER